MPNLRPTDHTKIEHFLWVGTTTNEDASIQSDPNFNLLTGGPIIAAAAAAENESNKGINIQWLELMMIRLRKNSNVGLSS